MAHRGRKVPAKPTQVQKALVVVRALSAAAARRLATRSVTKRRGVITGITIPLHVGRRKYLVMNIPKVTLKALVKTMGSLPQGEQQTYLKRWVERNQRAMYKEYINSGRKRRFRIGITAQGPTGLTGVRLTKLPSLPKQIKGGNGKKGTPYRVYPKTGRITNKRNIGHQPIIYPTAFFKSKTPIYFEIYLTASQLRMQSRPATTQELKDILRTSLTRHVMKNKLAIDNKLIQSALGFVGGTLDKLADIVIRRAEARKDYKLVDYIGKRFR